MRVSIVGSSADNVTILIILVRYQRVPDKADGPLTGAPLGGGVNLPTANYYLICCNYYNKLVHRPLPSRIQEFNCQRYTAGNQNHFMGRRCHHLVAAAHQITKLAP